MRRLRRCAVVVPLLLLAAACNDPIPGATKKLTAAEAAPPEEAVAAVTTPSTTTSTSTSTTAVPRTTTTLRAAPAPTEVPTTMRSTPPGRVPVTPAPPIAGYSPAPPPPGVDADGYGGYGGVTSASAGGVEVELSVYPREQYFGENVQVGVRVSHPEHMAITSIKVDYGNGHVVTSPPANSWYCNTAQPAGFGSSSYVYPAHGTFRITATATYVPCMGIPGAYVLPHVPPPGGSLEPRFREPHQAVSAGMDLLQRPDRPPRPVGPPPGP